MQIHCSTRSVILSATATQYTCSLKGIYSPHWLVQWSRHCLGMHIPVHSPWLPGYIDVVRTVLIILIMFALFPDRPCITQIKRNLYSRNFLTSSNSYQGGLPLNSRKYWRNFRELGCFSQSLGFRNIDDLMHENILKVLSKSSTSNLICVFNGVFERARAT